jgi:carnitine O-acetyltransferase
MEAEPRKSEDWGVTYSHQSELPKLPIPSLEQTCDRYLAMVTPLLTAAQAEKTKAAVQKWLKGDGPKLQNSLIEYSSTRNSYIEDFWFDAYLDSADAVVLNVNPFFVLEDDPTPSRNSQVERATSLLWSCCKFNYALRTQELAPDKWRDTALCMTQFKVLFGSCRQPHNLKDSIVTKADSKHIVVLCQSQFYCFDVVRSDGAVALTQQQIKANLQAIIDDASMTPGIRAANGAVAVLTTEYRPIWAKLKQRMNENEHNREILQTIDEALFVICLDNVTPKDSAEMAENCLHGTYKIREGVQVGTCTNR